MSTVSKNYDTHASDVTGSSLYKPQVIPVVLDDYVIRKNTPDSVILKNITGPDGLRETIEFQYQSVSDVYKNTDIERHLYSPSRRGSAAYVKITQYWTVSPSSGEAFDAYVVPVQVSFRIKVPSNGIMNESNIEDLYKRVLAALHTIQGVTDTPGYDLKYLLAGALNPKDRL